MKELINREDYLLSLESDIMNRKKWKKISKLNQWLNNVPKDAGVYLLRNKRNIIYVGETGNLKKRIKDLSETRNHSFRRTIGKKLFAHLSCYKDASSSKKFPQEIEIKLNEYIQGNIEVSYLDVNLGRKELEEFIECRLDPDCKLNKRGKRK